MNMTMKTDFKMIRIRLEKDENWQQKLEIKQIQSPQRNVTIRKVTILSTV